MSEKLINKSDMNKLIKENEIVENEIRVKAQNFLTLLHKKPNAKEIKINKHAGNSHYLPISFLEMKLDEMFFGAWGTRNFTYQGIANEIVGSIELYFYHPVFKKWLTRTGAASVQIQMKSKEKGGSGDITNIKDKYINTLTKDFPHLKADCFRNACLSIGKSFGRDLNRDFEDQYKPLIKDNPEVKLKRAKEEIITKIEYLVDDAKREKLKQKCVEKESQHKFDESFARQICGELNINYENL